MSVVIPSVDSRIGIEKLPTAATSRPPTKAHTRSKRSWRGPTLGGPPSAVRMSTVTTLSAPTSRPIRVKVRRCLIWKDSTAKIAASEATAA
jgi:hypothetical protein